MSSMVYKYDFLVIGAGVAGMSYALKVAKANKGKVCMICKTSLDEANTSFAQGGVASVTNMKVDTFDKHIADTIIASGASNMSKSTSLFIVVLCLGSAAKIIKN